jgi:hypothetical protein
LLVGSKGVARVLGELSGRRQPVNLGNAALAEFDLSARCVRAVSGEVS